MENYRKLYFSSQIADLATTRRGLLDRGAEKLGMASMKEGNIFFLLFGECQNCHKF